VNIEVKAAEPSVRTYAVIGRIPYDEEDSCYVVKASSAEEAAKMFADLIYKDAVGEDREYNIEAYGCDRGVYINHILVSDCDIEEM
jgi:hypothetical protein